MRVASAAGNQDPIAVSLLHIARAEVLVGRLNTDPNRILTFGLKV